MDELSIVVVVVIELFVVWRIIDELSIDGDLFSNNRILLIFSSINELLF